MEARLNVLIAELQHRTRNLLAIVQAIAWQTMEHGPAMQAFAMRLASIGRVQSLIGRSTTDRIDLAEIVRLELAAHGAGAGQRVSVHGPPVWLVLDHVQTFALALHELATNATRHGALAVERGTLDIGWTVTGGAAGEDLLRLDWQEHGVALSQPPNPAGYGRMLIERSLTFSLHARTQFRFGPGGVQCRMKIPLRPGRPAQQPPCPETAFP